MIPEKIGRYEIKNELGRGGMGTVYKAYDPTFKREVAVKVLPAELLGNPELRARFEREAQTIAQLEHPAIVPVYDFGEQDGQPFLVMRFMGGGSLSHRLSGGPVSLQETIRIAEQLAGALDKAHSKGIVHRDLKPGNILFDSEKNPYIADFGIAKLTQASVSLTQTATVMGTPAYMSPEQVRGDPTIDGRSDIYAFGAIIFEMLTGKVPYQADTPYALMMKHVMDPVPRILDNNPRLPAATQTVINRAMAKNREERFRTLGEMANMLEATTKPGALPVEPAGGEAAWKQATMAAPPVSPPMGVARPRTAPPGTPPPSGFNQSPLPARRRIPSWMLIAGGAALGLCLCVGAVAVVVMNLPESTPTAAAEVVEAPPEETPLPEAESTPTPSLTPDLAATQAALDAAATATAQVLAVGEAQQRATQTAEAESTARSESIINARRTSEARVTPTDDFSFNVEGTYYDEFNDNANDWWTGDWESDYLNGNASIVDGKYRWTATAKQGFTWWGYPSVIEGVSDFTMYIEAQVVDGPFEAKYGLIFRKVDDDNFYLFEVSNDGYYAVYLLYGGSWETIVEATYSAAIAAYDVNAITIGAIGSDFVLMVNDEFLTTISDDRLSSGGVGVLIELNNAGETATIEFDNFTFVSLD